MCIGVLGRPCSSITSEDCRNSRSYEHIPTREDPKHRTMEITPSGQMILLAEDYSITYRELGVLKRTVGESELFQG